MAEVLVDSTIAVILFGSVYEGYRRGLVTSLLGLAGFTSVLLLCMFFGELLSKPLKPYIPLPSTYATLLAYVVICFAIALASYFLHGLCSRLLTKKLPPALDAIGGMFVGGLRGAVFTALCLLILMLIANPIINAKIGQESRIGGTFFKEVSKVSPTVNEILTSTPSPFTTGKVTKGKSDYEHAVDSFKKNGGEKRKP